MKHPLRKTEALNRHGDKPRNPLGLGKGARVFAGGGDGTPEW